MGRLENNKDKRPRAICSMCGKREKVVINSIRNIYKCLNCNYIYMKGHNYYESIEVYDLE